MEKNQALREYIKNQIPQIEHRLEGYERDLDGNVLNKRNAFVLLQKYIRDFINKKAEVRMLVMPGFRGVGKTTLMAQLFLSQDLFEVRKWYISVDEVVRRFEVDLWEVIEAYEDVTGASLESLDTPIVLFFDEIQYEKKWATFLKTLFDRTKNVFVLCTGSAALLLRDQLNPDLARRVKFEEIYPVNFTEYMILRKGVFPVAGAGSQLRSALFNADKTSLYEYISNNKTQLESYWLNISKFEFERFLRVGTLPFTINTNNEALSVEYIGQTINKIIYQDLPQFERFKIETLNRVEQILYLLADSSSVSITSLSRTLGMRQETVSSVLRALTNAGLLLAISPNGRPYRQIRKETKYLFASPSFRYHFLMSRDSNRTLFEYRGNLFEDVVGMYLMRMLPKYGNVTLTYDSSENGADFVLTLPDKRIVIEVGLGNKGKTQVERTMKKNNADQGIVISQTDHKQIDDTITMLPMKYFLLM